MNLARIYTPKRIAKAVPRRNQSTQSLSKYCRTSTEKVNKPSSLVIQKVAQIILNPNNVVMARDIVAIVLDMGVLGPNTLVTPKIAIENQPLKLQPR